MFILSSLVKPSLNAKEPLFAMVPKFSDNSLSVIPIPLSSIVSNLFSLSILSFTNNFFLSTFNFLFVNDS